MPPRDQDARLLGERERWLRARGFPQTPPIASNVCSRSIRDPLRASTKVEVGYSSMPASGILEYDCAADFEEVNVACWIRH